MMLRNKKNNVARAFFETLLRDGNFSAYDEIMAEDVRGHCPASWEAIHAIEIHGRTNSREINENYLKALLFRKVFIHEMVPMADRVFVRWDAEGIHQGSFYAFPPTHRSFSVGGQTLLRLNKELQIAEVWQSWDMLGLLNQIGWQILPNDSNSGDTFGKLSSQAARLSQREKICLKLLAHGKTAKETASQLFVSHRTIEHYFENIKNKLDRTNKRELFALARLLETYKIL